MANVEKVLIQTVGTGGPNNPVWEALAFTVRQRRPDVLVFWCSRDTINTTVPKVLEVLGSDKPRDIRPTKYDDFENVDGLFRHYAVQIDELRREFPDAQIEVDFTSGTKPMSAAAVAAAVARNIRHIHYAVGLRDQTGRAVRTDSLVSLPATGLLADSLLNTLGRMFNAWQFDSVRVQAAALVSQLGPDEPEGPPLYARARSLEVIAEAYELWDRFDWKGAHSLLRRYEDLERDERILSRAGWDVNMLARQVQHVKICSGKKRTPPQRLADLLANAHRCLDRARYDDAVARLYRLVEYVVEDRLSYSKRQGAATAAPERSTRTVSPEELKKMGIRVIRRKALPGLRKLLHALVKTGDEVGRKIAEMIKSGRLGKLLGSRNESLLAHGTTPVSAEVARNLAGDARRVLEIHFEALGENLDELMVPAQFLRCPWV